MPLARHLGEWPQLRVLRIVLVVMDFEKFDLDFCLASLSR
jgi:hypothetical protein